MTIVEARAVKTHVQRERNRKAPDLVVWHPVIADAFQVKSQNDLQRKITPASEFFRNVAGPLRSVVSALALDRASAILALVTDQESAMPAVHQDEGGVALFWRRSGLSVQIDVTVDGKFYVRVRDRNSGHDFEAFQGEFPVATVKDSLRQLSASI